MKTFTKESFGTIFQIIAVIFLFAYPGSGSNHSSEPITAAKNITTYKPYIKKSTGIEKVWKQDFETEKKIAKPFDIFSGIIKK